MPGRLILASASLRRIDLLSQIGIPPDKTIAAEINEIPSPGELPRQVAARLALLKSRHVAKAFPNDFVLAADTVVASGRRILDQVKTATEAEAHLLLLSGRRHRVYSGVAVSPPNGPVCTRVVMTQVAFKRLHKSEIDTYLRSGEWRGMAGAYAIQGLAGGFVKRINGSYSNVVGLPLCETVALLKGAGLREKIIK